MLSRSCAHFPVDLRALNGNYALWGKTEPFVIVATKDCAQPGWPVELYTHPVIAGFPEQLQCFGQATNERFKHFQHQTKKVYKSSHQGVQRGVCVIFNMLKPLILIALMIYQRIAQRWFLRKGKCEQCIFNPLPVSFQACVCVHSDNTVFPLNSDNELMKRRERKLYYSCSYM